MQGVTELTTCERTSDLWLTKVQHEFREGNLTEESHAFLHGYPTMSPGSTVDGIARCLERTCSERVTAAAKQLKFNEAFARETMKIECDKCKHQRATRKPAADNEHDKRFKEKRFLTSPAVFPTNDSKYDVNKKRSLHVAASENKASCIA